MRLCSQIKIELKTHYFDYVDPSSGLLMLSSNHNITYCEATGVECFLRDKGFKVVSLGGC